MALVTDQTCRYEELDEGFTETCTPHTGSYMLEARPVNSPRSFEVNVVLDDTALLSRSGQFTYRTYGSADCGGCPRGDVDLTTEN